ncbi:hypothetical protein MRX96_016435 [Rhipicephalus microplus]
MEAAHLDATSIINPGAVITLRIRRHVNAVSGRDVLSQLFRVALRPDVVGEGIRRYAGAYQDGDSQLGDDRLQALAVTSAAGSMTCDRSSGLMMLQVPLRSSGE